MRIKKSKNFNLLLVDDTLVLPKPWWAGKLSSTRGMSQRKCCCSSIGTVGCTECIDGIAPAEVLLHLPALTLRDGYTCNDSTCGAYEGDYVLSVFSQGNQVCRWSMTLDAGCNPYSFKLISVQTGIIGSFGRIVSAGIYSGVNGLNWYNSLANKPDCMTWNALELTTFDGPYPFFPCTTTEYATITSL